MKKSAWDVVVLCFFGATVDNLIIFWSDNSLAWLIRNTKVSNTYYSFAILTKVTLALALHMLNLECWSKQNFCLIMLTLTFLINWAFITAQTVTLECNIVIGQLKSPLWRLRPVPYLTQLGTSGFHQLIWAIEKPSSQEEKRERSRSWTRTLREKHQITSLREGVSDADIRTSSCLQINQPVTTTQRLTHN